jgi:hypothetical protein
MRIIAGILMIIGGFPSACILMEILDAHGWIQALLFLIGYLSLIGGIYALRRVRWSWTLAGAICTLIFPIFGIPAIILLVKSKGEFPG